MLLDIKAIGQAILNSAIKIMFPLVERFVLNSRDQALAAAECHPSSEVEEVSLC